MSEGILVVSEVFPPAIGGSGALLENVYRRISGRHVRVLADDAPPGVAPYPGPLEVERVSMTAPDWGVLRPATLRRHVRVAAAIRGALDREPAVVHCARALPEGLSARMALANRGGRYVCWVHGEELGFASTSRELTWLARRVYQKAAAVIANSRNSATLITSQWGVPESRVHVIHPGVDTNRFTPDAAGDALRARVATAGDLVFLSVGRLQRRKGHDVVLRALARAGAQARRWRYVIVGEGPYRQQLESDVRSLGLSQVVYFAGPANANDLPGWYAASDVFVMPNRQDGVDFEGFGIVFIEAAAAGKPVIAGRSGGAPEAVAHDVTGLVVDGADVSAVTEALMALAESDERRRRYGRAGRTRAVAEFGWDRAARELERLAETLG